jgi:hypothetical protein
MQEQAELRFTYRPSPANYKVFVHLFISFFKVKLLIAVSFCVNICEWQYYINNTTNQLSIYISKRQL